MSVHPFFRSSVHQPDGYPMLMSPVKGETAVHGYLWPGDMVVGMCKVLAAPYHGVGTCASVLNLVLINTTISAKSR